MDKRVKCNDCGVEMHVEIRLGTLDSSKFKCPSCKSIEYDKNVENLMSAIFKTRTKIQNS